MSQQERFCQACGMPMSAEEAKSASDDYCAWCCDSEGKLKSWRMPFPAWLSSSILAESWACGIAQASDALFNGHARVGS